MSYFSSRYYRDGSVNLSALREVAPSVFADRPWDRVSNRYRFLPSIDSVLALSAAGFAPVAASQSRTRIAGKAGFARHLIRFRRTGDEFRRGQEVSEVVLVNSHDGSSTYRLFGGVFRVLCENGLVVSVADAGQVVARHTGDDDFKSTIVDAAFTVVANADALAGKIDQWKSITLDHGQQVEFATAAYALRGTSTKVDADSILAPRRVEDRSDAGSARSLWLTLNVVQENLVRGGLPGLTSTGRHRATSAIRAVDANVQLNQGLWAMASDYAAIAA